MLRLRRTPRAAALALAVPLAAPFAAVAQSNVALSGILDAAVRQVSNEGVGSLKSVTSGSNATSRIALSGREDLGGGLSAGFHLEHGLAVDSGTAASDKFWDRRSTVSLTSSTLGEVRLGRDYVPTYTSWTRHDPFSYVGVARSANVVSGTPLGPVRSAFGSNANTTVRADNALQWLLPGNLGGLEGGVMLAPSEGGAVAAGKARVVAARLGWSEKAFAVSAAVTQSKNAQTSAAFRDATVGVQGAVSWLRLSAAWREFALDAAKQRAWLVGAVATFGPHELKASWLRSDMAGRVGTTAVDANDATQVGLGYVYNLSRRTALYASTAHLANRGGARFVIPEGPAGMAAGGTSRGHEVGLRHRF